ncbi:MAG: hypothetical protein O7D86_15370 [Proteobacteria bacterium]|nr:hypothetical protein [Pseudomonadota bacterium]
MTILLPGLLLSTSCSVTRTRGFWEIPDSNLPQIAKVRLGGEWGYTVIYNPVICKQIGAACGFFRTHEYAHYWLDHPLAFSPTSYPASYEAEVDCWTARYGNPNEVFAAYQLFLEDGSNPNWSSYGDPNERAERIRTCAIQTGNWIES